MITRKDRSQETKTQPQAFRENPEVNAAIDKYIADNPNHWNYIRSLPPERMARMLVLSAVKQQKQQTKLHAAILSKVDENPELKEALTKAVAALPEAKREAAMVRLGGQMLRELKPEPAKAGQSVRV